MKNTPDNHFLKTTAYAQSAIESARQVLEEDRPADVLDQASRAERQGLHAQLATAAQLAAPQSHPDFDGKHCVEEDCGEELPSARISAGRIRCVTCQEKRELLAKQRGMPIWTA